MSEQSQRWDHSPLVEAQVEELLQQLTLAQKVALVSGDVVQENANAPQLPFPAFGLADGPSGVRREQGDTTALPAPIALAATWEPALAQRYGDLIGAEAVATNIHVLLGPAVDIARAPHAGRTFESFGEDPLLQARMIAPEVEAIQAHGVATSIKHYIVNNQEYQRNSIDVQVGERALQEIYLPPFAAAIRDAGATSVMGSYNRINGVFACENPHTLTELLRDQLDFRGWVISDFMANHSTVASLQAGLDWELASHKLWASHLVEAIGAGQVSEETLDTMVRRILRTMVGLNLFERQTPLVDWQAHRQAAREIAEQAIVLLKNQDSLLPLSHGTIRSIAVIGPSADTIEVAGGGSARVVPKQGVSVLDAIRAVVGADVTVNYASGVDPIGPGVLLPGPSAVPSAVLRPGKVVGERGLHAEYWLSGRIEGQADITRVEPQIDLNRGFFEIPGFSVASPKLEALPPNLGAQFAARWSGTLTVPTAGEYIFSLTVLGSAKLFFDDQLLITIDQSHVVSDQTIEQLWTGAGAQIETVRLSLSANEAHAVRIEYLANRPGLFFINGPQLRFGWQPPADVVLPSFADAAALAAECDVAIVVAHTYESEAQDRPSLRLPNNQDGLIRAVAAANPRTVVVVMSGAAVDTSAWDDLVPALVEAWYPGQEQGDAIARVLFGEVNPSGRLPLSFPQNEQHTPLRTPEQYPGIDNRLVYSEGIFVGYRGYDHLGIEPRYPFGYGLSYASFEYTNLVVENTTDGLILLHFSVANTGSVAGIEVAQVYLGLPASANEPPKRLVGWARLHLAAGQQQQATITLDPASSEHVLAYWDETIDGWAIAPGEYCVFIGASSRDIRLTGHFTR